MIPAILSAVFFIKDLRINNSVVAGRILMFSMLVILLVVLSFVGIKITYINFDFITNTLFVSSGLSNIRFTTLLSIVFYQFMFLNDEGVKKCSILLKILPFLLIGISSEPIIIGLIVSSFFYEDILNKNIPSIFRVGFSVTFFLYIIMRFNPQIINESDTLQIIFYLAIFLTLSLIFNAKMLFKYFVVNNKYIEALSQLYFIGCCFVLKRNLFFDEKIFSYLIGSSFLIYFLSHLLLDRRGVKSVLLNIFIAIWLYNGSFGIEFISIFIILNTIEFKVKNEKIINIKTKNIMNIITNNIYLIIPIIILKIVLILLVSNKLVNLNPFLALSFAVTYWFVMKKEFKELIITTLVEKSIVLENLLAISWGLMLLFGITFYE